MSPFQSSYYACMIYGMAIYPEKIGVWFSRGHRRGGHDPVPRGSFTHAQFKARARPDNAGYRGPWRAPICRAALYGQWGPQDISRGRQGGEKKLTKFTNPQCNCPITHNTAFRTELCTFLFWMVHCGVWEGALWDLWDRPDINLTWLSIVVVDDMGPDVQMAPYWFFTLGLANDFRDKVSTEETYHFV